MPILESVYAAGVRALRPALPLLARGEGKLARGIRGRGGVLERMEAWARAHRDPARPLAWFHAPSVGEGHQARAVIQSFRARRPDAQVAYTFFSPSAEAFARTVPADFADYLPLDAAPDVRRALDALRPAVIAFSKYDVWPVLTREAAARGIRLVLLSATLPARAGRLRGPARALLAPAYARLHAVAAISADDAERFARLGVPSERRSVMGDARFDQVWQRARGVDPSSPLLAPFAGFDGITLVAGSTWPEDERHLLPAVAALGGEKRSVRLILVPHEPTDAHLASTERRLDEIGLAHARLSALDAISIPPVVIVDRVGVLGDLYALADVALVGGGFGKAGLHSVLEPAAFGAPVMFGPRHENAREAAELVAAGGAFEVATAADAERILGGLADVYEVRVRAGQRARAYVEAHPGAAERGAAIVERLIG
ncbi:3-deoxy-D-manno-octulosonic acid transferase [Longimicrobium sp.]|uniref:3-deoxy-D-manno-octulosonic acid transferase n=1 Tax=Longimicrobium sp. TaxID=2029185 RepID=UPI002B8F0937|nr:glycosyltransferase N-terminal domain-containing protein [Longimicrobium sp.]HSU14904.1 glycosyltransferase N-terminal domain-containing protein [Longimicrobium sp.]